MDTIFPLKPKSSIKAVNDNNAMMRLKMQNALIQQELNRVKAANAALALQAHREHQQREHEARLALQAHREHEARLALQAHREHEARLALQAHREHEARLALEARHQHQQHQQHHHQQEAPVAPQIKKSKFGKLLSDMNKLK